MINLNIRTESEDAGIDLKKLKRRVIIGASITWFALCLHGVYLEITIGRV